MKSNVFYKRMVLLFGMAISLLAAQSPSFADATNETTYCGIPLSNGAKQPGHEVLNRYGVPFIAGMLPLVTNGSSASAHIEIGGRAKWIFLLGMTDTAKAHSWTNLREGYARRYFIGDNMGTIRLEYADGSTQVFPLIYGESLWWGQIFYDNPKPFDSDTRLQAAFEKSLRLYPAAPVKDGNYVAVIVPKDTPIKEIVVENNPAKIGVPVINGMTIEPAEGETISGATALPGESLSPEFAKFAEEKPLCLQGVDESGNQARLEALKRVFYMSDARFKGHVSIEIPQGYSGPLVSFKGGMDAKILANAFYANIQDITEKVTDDGMYHTSTKGAPNWSAYSGFGTYQTNIGKYYGESWSRDMGRSLQELTDLDYTNEALRCADYCLRTARTNQFKLHGEMLPPHWGRIANKPQDWCVFENDGQGLVMMFLYQLWQRLPDRDDWLRARWPDIKAAGDWILWEFDHPEISGAKNGILYTTSESANMIGYSVYPDYSCMEALEAFAQMADSIAETNSAAPWRDRADKMRQAIATQYTTDDPKYGRVWTLRSGGWPNRSTVLGPLILPSDYRGFAPEDEDPNLRSVNEAAYKRLVDSYNPYGFYGQAMGYGQGFVAQAALLLDRMRDATTMLNWAAKEIYDPRFGSFIAPEACDIDPTGRYWYRISDLGNGVQEGEIVKMLRLVIGVDDTRPDRLQFYPRMPYGWNEMAVTQYPVLFDNSGKIETTSLRYKLERSRKGMKLEICADQALGPVVMRLGPFEKQPEIADIQVNGQEPAGASIEHSGDSWWVKFTAAVGPIASK